MRRLDRTLTLKVMLALQRIGQERVDTEKLSESDLAKLVGDEIGVALNRHHMRHMEEAGVIKPWHPRIEGRRIREEDMAAAREAVAKELGVEVEKVLRSVEADLNDLKEAVSTDISKTDERLMWQGKRLGELENRVAALAQRHEELVASVRKVADRTTKIESEFNDLYGKLGGR